MPSSSASLAIASALMAASHYDARIEAATFRGTDGGDMALVIEISQLGAVAYDEVARLADEAKLPALVTHAETRGTRLRQDAIEYQKALDHVMKAYQA